jgi:hypothetical protein
VFKKVKEAVGGWLLDAANVKYFFEVPGNTPRADFAALTPGGSVDLTTFAFGSRSDQVILNRFN